MYQQVASSSPSHNRKQRRHHEVVVAMHICRLLTVQAMTLREIAASISYSERAARRYIYALRAAGVDIVNSYSSKNWRGVDGDPYEDLEGLASANRLLVDGQVSYRLDPRSWAGLLYLPADGMPHIQKPKVTGAAAARTAGGAA